MHCDALDTVSINTQFFLTIPALAGFIALLSDSQQFAWWQRSLILLFPAVFWLCLSYRLNLARLAHEKSHVEDMVDLHLRTIEALSLAIEAEAYITPGTFAGSRSTP
jgi:hypothetical protein